MRVSDVLDHKGREVVTVPAMTSVLGLARLLRSRRIGAVVVVDDNHAMIGIVSERDVVHHIARDGDPALHAPVSDIMSAPVETCAPEDDIRQLMATMTRQRIRHVPVIDHGRLAGIVSIGDVVKHRLADNRLEINVLRDAALAHSIAAGGPSG
jgi:CBS domain-containing protein